MAPYLLNNLWILLKAVCSSRLVTFIAFPKRWSLEKWQKVTLKQCLPSGFSWIHDCANLQNIFWNCWCLLYSFCAWSLVSKSKKKQSQQWSRPALLHYWIICETIFTKNTLMSQKNSSKLKKIPEYLKILTKCGKKCSKII